MGSRLIPARAGKTVRAARVIAGARAHPRSRGENMAHLLALANAAGSSPLARGKLEHVFLRNDIPRLIPARAGKTHRWGGCDRDLGAHPRSRGENEDSGTQTSHLTGSSPLARGKRPRECPHAPRGGLIPARAGKTVRSVS